MVNTLDFSSSSVSSPPGVSNKESSVEQRIRSVQKVTEYHKLERTAVYFIDILCLG